MKLVANLASALQRLRWQMSQAWTNLSVLDLLAIALLLLWGGMQWQVVMPLQVEKNTLISAVQHARYVSAAGTSLPAQAVTTPIGSDAAFLAFLPPAERRDTILKTIHELIFNQGLSLLHADYKLETDPVLPINKLGLRLSVEGSYVPLRQFLHMLLEKVPSLAINQIDLEKDDKTPDSMTLTLDTSLYLRQTPERLSP